MTPKFHSLASLQYKLKESVIGQDAACDYLSTIVYRHFMRALYSEFKGIDLPGGFNVLLKGSTGSGKTFMIKKVAELCGLPVALINAKSLSQEGWTGKSFIDLVCGSLTREEVGQYPIIVIDEFDKLMEPNDAVAGDVSVQLQYGLLQYIEGFRLKSSSAKIWDMDTGKFLFILAGAFTKMEEGPKSQSIGFTLNSTESEINGAEINVYEKLQEHGCIPELAGRIRHIIQLNKLTKKDLADILASKSASFAIWTKTLLELGVSADLYSNDEIMLSRAVEKNLGARGLLHEIEDRINRAISANQHLLTLNRLITKKPEEDNDL